MNGLGVGTLLGLVGVIGLQLMQPDAVLAQYGAAFVFWAFPTGMLFELYRYALTYKRPFGR